MQSLEELENILKKYTGLPDEIPFKKSNRKIIKRKEDVITEEKILDNEYETVSLISLSEWMKKYNKSIPDYIKIINFDITGIPSDEYLLVKVPHPKGGQMDDGNERKELLMYKNINRIPVLDLDAVEINMYNSGIRLVHQFKNGFIKEYTGKGNYTVAVLTDNNLIPYHISKVKNNILIFRKNNFNIEKILKENIVKEEIKLLYKMILKNPNWPNMKTNEDVCNYFLELQKNLRDHAHHIKLDNIMIGMITGSYPENENIATHVNYQVV